MGRKRLQIVFDSRDPASLSDFYAKVLGYKLQDPPEGFESWREALKAWGVPEEDWNSQSAIVDPKGDGPRIYFQRMETPKLGKNRVHIDVNATEGPQLSKDERRAQVRAEVKRIVALGASIQREWEEDQDYWFVLLDPEGNEFCVQ